MGHGIIFDDLLQYLDSDRHDGDGGQRAAAGRSERILCLCDLGEGLNIRLCRHNI